MLRHISIVAALICVALSLTGCGSINAWLSSKLADNIPAWAGGLPPDAPPRPGTQAYDEWKKEIEQKRQAPKPQEEQASVPGQSPGNRPEP